MDTCPDRETIELPTQYLNDPILSKDERFNYLKNKLEAFYYCLQTSNQPEIRKNRSKKWNKNLQQKLHLLLKEIILTRSSTSQEELLQNTYKWYREKLEVSERANYLPDIKFKTPSVSLPPVDRYISSTPKFPGKKHYFYMPKNKNHCLSREELLEKASKKYSQLMSEGKIDLSFFGHKKVKVSNQISSDAGKSISSFTPMYKNNDISESPVSERRLPGIKISSSELQKSPTQYDYRSQSHKYRVLEKGAAMKNFQNASSIRVPEVNEIHEVKSRLAQKNMIISVKNLEYALSTQKQTPYEQLNINNLPKGGEFLIKNQNKEKSSLKSRISPGY